MKDRRRTRGFWNAVVDDPVRKLIAISLAALTWWFVNNRINDEETRRLVLKVVDPTQVGAASDLESNRLVVHLPGDRVAAGRFLDGEVPIDAVTISLRGPRFKIDAIREQTLNLVVTAFMGRDWGRPSPDGQGMVGTIEFTAANIVRDVRELQGVEVELVPARVRLEYQRLDDFSVELASAEALGQVDIVADPGIVERLRRDTARYLPSHAKVLGSAAGIARLKARQGPAFRVQLRGAANENQVSGQLEILGGEELGIRFETRPSLTMDLLPKTDTFTVELPIVIDDASQPPEERGRYEPVDASRSVSVRVAGNRRTELLLKSPQEVQKWASENLRLHVYLPPREQGVQITGEVLDRRVWLVPAGPLAEKLERKEVELADPQTVKLRRKQP